MDDGDSSLSGLGIVGMPLPGASSGFYTVLRKQAGAGAKTVLGSPAESKTQITPTAASSLKNSSTKEHPP